MAPLDLLEREERVTPTLRPRQSPKSQVTHDTARGSTNKTLIYIEEVRGWSKPSSPGKSTTGLVIQLGELRVVGWGRNGRFGSSGHG
jgi:hypothetical protein